MKHEHSFIQSAMLSSCAYDGETKELTVTFTNGKSYVYEEVDPQTYACLIEAESAGRYFNSIKGQLKVKK